MKISDLTHNPKNPRKITDEKLALLKKSLETFGDLSGVIYNRVTQRLAGGHQRTKVLPAEAEVNVVKQYEKPTKQGTVSLGHIKIGDELYAYREVMWDEPTELAANMAANNQGGEFDYSKLPDVLLEIDQSNIDLDLTGFSEEELKEIMAPLAKIEGQCDEDEVPKQVKSNTQVGDLYILGNHRLLCGDSTNILQVEKLMNGEKADITFTSPPYNAGAAPGGLQLSRYRKYINYEADNKSENEYKLFLNSFLFCAKESSKVQLINLSMLEGGKRSIIEWLFDNREFYLDQMIWKKASAAPSPPNVLTHNHEHIFIFSSKEKPNRRLTSNNFTHAFSVVESALNPNNEHADVHQATFPISLCENVFEIACPSPGKVYDPFGGSGSTLIACEKTSRKCFMMEIDPHYCDVIVARWEKYTGQKASLVSKPNTKLKKANRLSLES